MDMIQFLRDQLKKPLPGPGAHVRMMHGLRHYDHRVPQPDARKAGVLLLLFPADDLWHTVFIKRKMKIGVDAHSGQISLPGGKHEKNDPDLAYTAAREAEEEIGVNKHKLSMLGALSDLYIPVSNFHVHPFVGYVDYTPQFNLQDDEVDEVIPVSIEHLRDPKIRQTVNITTPSGLELQDVPYFDLSGKILWGATAMIINEFIEMLEGHAIPLSS
jgi:8-oxo-dGTP pyrophosphatase MutT (NUDIX family)